MRTTQALPIISFIFLVFSLLRINSFHNDFGLYNINNSNIGKIRFVSKLFSTTTSVVERPSVVERLNLKNNFRRWRYMQQLLDEELEAENVNEVLYVLLDNYKKGNRGSDTDEASDRNAPERTTELVQSVKEVLDMAEENSKTGRKGIPILRNPDCQPGDAVLLEKIEKLLPDPADKKDAFEGGWDSIRDMHGGSSMDFSEGEGRAEWKAVSLAARVMVYFELLTLDGLIPPKINAP